MRAIRLTALIALVFALPLPAQEIKLENFERCGELLCFQSASDPLVYYYVPDRPAIAAGENGKPEFSFLKYVRNVAGSDDEGGIQEASGGGVVHFLVTYEVPAEAVEEAREELAERIEEATLEGPILFRSGTFALVTSIADPQGRFADRVVGVGKAPLIEGLKAAVSIDLNPEGASLLWESFKMENPDISIVFDMEIAGYRNPYEATMEVDWDQVYEQHDMSAGAKVFMLGADVEAKIESLLQSGAIKLTTRGENAAMSAIVERAHAKMIELMFARVDPEETRKSTTQTDPLAAISSLVKGRGRAGSLLPINLYAAYKLKDIKRSGRAVFDFNHYAEDTLGIVMAGNIGDLYNRFGADPAVFRATNLDDPVFTQREVFVTIDGRSEADFDDYINYVTVQLRKSHEGGETTLDEVYIDRDRFKNENNRFRLVYGWKSDNDRAAWLRFDYRTVWNFSQGISYESEWRETDQFVINVTPPYEYRRISIEADPEVFEERGVRHALVKFFYTFYGKEIERQVVVRVKDDAAVVPLEYVCEAGNYDYEYEITWYMRDRGRISLPRMGDSSEILYADELPEEDSAIEDEKPEVEK